MHAVLPPFNHDRCCSRCYFAHIFLAPLCLQYIYNILKIVPNLCRSEQNIKLNCVITKRLRKKTLINQRFNVEVENNILKYGTRALVMALNHQHHRWTSGAPHNSFDALACQSVRLANQYTSSKCHGQACKCTEPQSGVWLKISLLPFDQTLSVIVS